MNFLAKYTFLCLFTAFNVIFFFEAKALNPPVKYLGIEQGLSNNAVTSVIQDHYGFMWIGTYNGLNRFDSSNFLVYNNILGDPYSLINNHINRLAQDSAGRIWVGTQKGVVYFNYRDAKFRTVNYKSVKSGKKAKIISNINGFAAAKTGEVYIATDDLGLLVYDAKAGIARQIVFNRKQGSYHVQTLLLDEKYKLWLFIKDVGLCVYNKANQQINVVNPLLKTAACLESDQHGNIWIGTELGLYKYDQISGKLMAVGARPNQLTTNNILNLHLSKDNLWIATDGGGVNILNINTGSISYILPGESDGFLKSGAISDIYEDKESRKWIATLRGGTKHPG